MGCDNEKEICEHVNVLNLINLPIFHLNIKWSSFTYVYQQIKKPSIFMYKNFY